MLALNFPDIDRRELNPIGGCLSAAPFSGSLISYELVQASIALRRSGFSHISDRARRYPLIATSVRR
jgi:hypothetical protein